MKLKNCERCGKIFKSAHPTLCPDCVAEDEEDFTKVRNFIKANPKVAIEVVVEATGVEEERIRDFIRYGQIESADLKGPALECKRCGKPIYMGNYCVICRGEITNNFKAAETEETRQKSAEKRKTSFTRSYRNRK